MREASFSTDWIISHVLTYIQQLTSSPLLLRILGSVPNLIGELFLRVVSLILLSALHDKLLVLHWRELVHCFCRLVGKLMILVMLGLDLGLHFINIIHVLLILEQFWNLKMDCVTLRIKPLHNEFHYFTIFETIFGMHHRLLFADDSWIADVQTTEHPLFLKVPDL